MAVHHPYQHITEEPFISHPHNTNDQSIEHQYLTTDGIDIENQLTPHIYREREELQQYVQTNKQSKRQIDKHSTPKIHQPIQDGEEAIKQSDWSTNDLIQLV
uniref:Uncharacterized protein n=1 Tax=Heterorhabditis bacteriophora TaxID=37862 RepID=A0A1I7WID9_HETBA